MYFKTSRPRPHIYQHTSRAYLLSGRRGQHQVIDYLSMNLLSCLRNITSTLNVSSPEEECSRSTLEPMCFAAQWAWEQGTIGTVRSVPLQHLAILIHPNYIFLHLQYTPFQKFLPCNLCKPPPAPRRAHALDACDTDPADLSTRPVPPVFDLKPLLRRFRHCPAAEVGRRGLHGAPRHCCSTPVPPQNHLPAPREPW